MKFLFFIVLFWGFNSYGCDAASLPWKTADHVCNRDLCKVALSCQLTKTEVLFEAIEKGRLVFILPRFQLTSKEKEEMFERVNRIAVLLLKRVLEDRATFTPVDLFRALRFSDQKVGDDVKQLLLNQLEDLANEWSRLKNLAENERMKEVGIVMDRLGDFYGNLDGGDEVFPSELKQLEAFSKLVSEIVNVLDQMHRADQVYVRSHAQKLCETYCNSSYTCKFPDEQKIQRKIEAIEVKIENGTTEQFKLWKALQEKIKPMEDEITELQQQKLDILSEESNV